MILHTISLSQWRKCKALNIELYDITVKMGDKIFAPSKALLNDYKYHNLSDSDYITRYTQEMRDSYKHNKQHWLDFIAKDVVAIACFCRWDSFCHRCLLVDMLEKVCMMEGVEFEYRGEVQ